VGHGFGEDGARFVAFAPRPASDPHWWRIAKPPVERHCRRERLLGGLQTTQKTGDTLMPLTYDFKETIRARAQAEPAFRQALLREAVECLINGDLPTGKAVLRDYVNASAGFQDLEKRTCIPAKSLKTSSIS